MDEGLKYFDHYFEPAAISRVVTAMARAVDTTFMGDKAGRTRDEWRRRFKMAYELVMVLRADYEWTHQHICDDIGRLLQATLDGVSFEPSGKTTWVAENKETVNEA